MAIPFPAILVAVSSLSVEEDDALQTGFIYGVIPMLAVIALAWGIQCFFLAQISRHQ